MKIKKVERERREMEQGWGWRDGERDGIIRREKRETQEW